MLPILRGFYTWFHMGFFELRNSNDKKQHDSRYMNQNPDIWTEKNLHIWILK